ncbi:hypothetical protein, conserved [Entamoeba dispar SAW760]|uniref:MAGE domain-containing protein n=1 Tax=Entamoeba dispar (strain ATCC PRA-260 / SAW760) TaxID=370354 RepID=B0ETX6_ENTDS|nr:uncharacterized protein EDI_201810 [Entamoeba dispar SAW760]EDR22064.1 hypothetical protein, conserved [Entamoeba dispar SAW760]|eukprot:EDR22064.1 hypothetical protein, conserved [Entamoeba dispar SAW760]
MSHQQRKKSNRQFEDSDLLLDDSDSDIEEISPKRPSEKLERTQRSQKIATQSKKGDLTPEETNLLVNDIMRKVLAYQVSKKLLTRDDISKTVFAKYKISPRNTFKSCMEEASNRLKKQFGFELKEIKSGNSGKSVYILLDGIQDIEEPKTYTVEGMTNSMIIQQSITFIILSLTMLNGEAIFQEVLVQHLRTLDICSVPEQPSLEFFIDKVLTKQGYLRRIIIQNDNGSKTIKYSLGVRTYAELGKDMLYSKIAQIHGEELGESERSMFKKETERFLTENYDEVEDANLLDNDETI